MSQLFKRILLALVTVVVAGSASAYSLLGPFPSWQVPAIGYDPLGNVDIGGPMNLGEEYRWNVPTIYYGYDESFLNYFGAEGTNAIEKAIAILNALPAMSQTSSNLAEFPMDTKRVNYRASALRLRDMKSFTLATLVEEMGLASPERYVWTLRSRLEDPLRYLVVKRNFDPVTFSPSSFVNGTLYTYVIQDPVPTNNTTALVAIYADAIEIQTDPLQTGYTAVASGVDDIYAGNLAIGEFYTGLTQDDIGGWRYLYRTNNYQLETLLDGTTAGPAGSGSPWQPVGGTNSTGTNNVVNLAVRPGVDKITFKLGKYDSMVGTFITVSNTYTDKYVSGSTVKSQSVQRVLTAPDVLFQAEDLGLFGGSVVPILFERSDTAAWINNDALNGQATLDGPGVIPPQVVLTYGKIGPYFINVAPNFLGEINSRQGVSWGSFDGSTNEPVVFPVGTSIQDLEQQILFGGGSGGPSPWTIPNSTGTITNTP